MAFVPQTAMSALDPVQRLRGHFLEVLCERGGLSGRAAVARAAELFDLVGLPAERLADYPHQFSGGMRQRASIALALALEPALVIADEPVTALDVIVQRQVLDVLRALQARLGLAMILVTHDMSVVAYTCDRVAVMYAGQVVEAGHGAGGAGAAAASVQHGADARVPGSGGQRGGAGADRGIAAVAVGSAAGLPVRAAVPVCGGAVPGGGAAAGGA